MTNVDVDAPRVGRLEAGPLDSLADVAGVTVSQPTQAIVDALFRAETVSGFRSHVRHASPDVAPDWRALGE